MCYLYVAIYRYISPYGAIRGRPFSSLTLIHQVVPRLCYLASLALPRALASGLISWLPYHKEKERFLPWGEHKRLLWPFRGPKGSFKGPRGLPWAPGGSPKSFPWGVKMLQNHYKTCVILRFVMIFCKILNISLEVLQKKSMYYSGRFLTGHFCDT